MPQTKIQRKFYPLKNSEWLDSIDPSTHSELKILYYVRPLNPDSLIKLPDLETTDLVMNANVTAEEVK